MLLSNNLERFAACVLTDTLNKFPTIPNKNKQIASMVEVGAIPMQISVIG